MLQRAQIFFLKPKRVESLVGLHWLGGHEHVLQNAQCRDTGRSFTRSPETFPMTARLTGRAAVHSKLALGHFCTSASSAKDYGEGGWLCGIGTEKGAWFCRTPASAASVYDSWAPAGNWCDG